MYGDGVEAVPTVASVQAPAQVLKGTRSNKRSQAGTALHTRVSTLESPVPCIALASTFGDPAGCDSCVIPTLGSYS